MARLMGHSAGSHCPKCILLRLHLVHLQVSKRCELCAGFSEECSLDFPIIIIIII